MAQESKIDLALKLRQLETLLAEIELTTNRLAVYFGQTGAEARTIEYQMRKIQDNSHVSLGPVRKLVAERQRARKTDRLPDVNPGGSVFVTNEDLNFDFDSINVQDMEVESEESIKKKVMEEKKLKLETEMLKRKMMMEEAERENMRKKGRVDLKKWTTYSYKLASLEPQIEHMNQNHFLSTCHIKTSPLHAIFNQEDLLVNFVDVTNYQINYTEHEELLNHVIYVRSSARNGDVPYEFQLPIRLLIPHPPITRTRETVIKVLHCSKSLKHKLKLQSRETKINIFKRKYIKSEGDEADDDEDGGEGPRRSPAAADKQNDKLQCFREDTAMNSEATGCDNNHSRNNRSFDIINDANNSCHVKNSLNGKHSMSCDDVIVVPDANDVDGNDREKHASSSSSNFNDNINNNINNNGDNDNDNDDCIDVDNGDDENDDVVNDGDDERSSNTNCWEEKNTVKLNNASEAGFTSHDNNSVSYIPIDHIPRHGLLFAIVSRPKCDKSHFGPKGGKLIQSVDSRINVLVPKLAFEEKTEVQLQTIWNSNSAISKFKQQQQRQSQQNSHADDQPIPATNDSDPEFLGITPFLSIETEHNPLKHLMVKIIQPSGASKRKKMKSQVKFVANNPDGDEQVTIDNKNNKDIESDRNLNANNDINHNDDNNNTTDGRPNIKTHLTLPPLFNSINDQNVQSKPPKDYIVLVTKDTTSKWKARPEVEFIVQNDVILFVLTEPLKKLAFLRLSQPADPAIIAKMISAFEVVTYEKESSPHPLHHHLLPTSHHSSSPSSITSSIVLECVRAENIEKVVYKFDMMGYDSVRTEETKFSIHEGDRLKLIFKGNVRFKDNGDVRSVVFHSNLSTCFMQADISEIDSFAQNALLMYRGCLQIRSEKSQQPKRQQQQQMRVLQKHESRLDEKRSQLTKKQTSMHPGVQWNSKTTSVEDDGDADLLCEIQILLPKKRHDPPNLRRIQIAIKDEPPLSGDFFDRLSSSLGDKWTSLAEKLKISQVSVQRIKNSCTRRFLTEESEFTSVIHNMAAKQMLFQWFKTSPKSSNKVKELRWALAAVGRNDLLAEFGGE
ncbi:hypothetical protein HELRODRAFT_171983 [Helobdella robusta]|uniref:Death domain-containing protein n=1 Tax=Helobdella robusta TaxID=6412 RepID=T1F4W9_HELRO|nr:hypothetical protein HELRODRAFT_171983 [Helobdella robusta]ESO04976.1 hypothetical protein HELRODRAFT_171983 [Helobdella robusta]